MEKNLFSIGRVVKPPGVKGKVKVEYFGEDLRHFSLYRKIFVEGEKGKPEPYEIIEAIHHPRRVLRHIGSRDRHGKEGSRKRGMDTRYIPVQT